MTDHTDLIKRLRDWDMNSAPNPEEVTATFALVEEAADALENQQVTLDVTIDDLKVAEKMVRKREAEIERLKEEVASYSGCCGTQCAGWRNA